MIDIKEYSRRQFLIETALIKLDILTESHILNLRSANIVYAINSIFENNDFPRAKQLFFNCALLDSYISRNFQSRFFDYTDVRYVLLSDNWSYLENTYSRLRYESFYIDDNTNQKLPLSMDEMVLQGESAIWCNTIQFFMANDFERVEMNMNIIETLTLPKLPNNQQELKVDFEFYKALLSKNKEKCEEILEQLASPRIHKKRNDNTVLNQYVSQPALGYAKLAWKQGLEVKVNSPLVPKDILPIEPLPIYEIPYSFLREDNI